MKKLACLFLFVSAFAFAKPHEYREGRILDISTEGASGAAAVPVGRSLVMAPMWFGNVFFYVRLDGIVYTARGKRINGRTKDYGDGFIAGDPVQAAVEGTDIYLQRSGKKDLKLSVMKRERP